MSHYVAAGHATSPYLTIYHQDSPLTFTKVANPASLPPSTIYSVLWSPAGEHLLVGGVGFISIYTHVGDTFTDQGDLPDVPADRAIISMAMSPDGRWLLVGISGLGTCMLLYERSGASYVLADTQPPSQVASKDTYVAWSRDGAYATAAIFSGTAADSIRIWSVTDGAFTLVSGAANPDVFPASGYATDCAWLGTGSDYLAVSHRYSPYITIYHCVDDVFTKLADPATLPGAYGFSCAYSIGGHLLAVGSTTAPRLTVYEVDGETYTALTPPTPPATTVQSIRFAPDDTSMGYTHSSNPRIEAHSWDGDFAWTALEFDTALPNGGNDLAYFPYYPSVEAWHMLIT